MRYERKDTITVVKETTDYICCDFCGDLLHVNLNMESRKAAKQHADMHYLSTEQIPYYTVMTMHHDWDNDSVESVQHFDVCEDCIHAVLAGFADHFSNTKSLEVEMKTGQVPTEELLKMIPDFKMRPFKPHNLNEVVA